MCPPSPTGRPYPSAALARPEGLGCNRRCVGVERVVRPQSSTGRPYPSAVQAGPEGLGCNHRCLGAGGAVCPPIPTGRPDLRVSQAGPGGLGCHSPRGRSGRCVVHLPLSPQTEMGRRPRVALAVAVGVSQCRGWLGGGLVLTPSYLLATAGK